MQFVIIAKRCSEFAKLHDYPCSCEQLQFADGWLHKSDFHGCSLPKRAPPVSEGASIKYEKS